jgi:hypothetical protein
MVELVPGAVVTATVAYAIDQVEHTSAAIPPPPPPPPPPSPPPPSTASHSPARSLPPGLGPGVYTGIVLDAGLVHGGHGGSEATILVDGPHVRLSVSSASTCAIHFAGRVILHIYPDGDVVVFASGSDCTMRITSPA